MVFLNDAAATAYFFITRDSINLGFINIFEFYSRMACLFSMLPQNSDFREIISGLLEEAPAYWKKGEYLTDENNTQENTDEIEEKRAELKFCEPDDPNHLCFMTKTKGILGDVWKFRINDDDFFPSIPHGHLKGKNNVKLDSYRGFTYDTLNKNRALNRETRNYIINLWNEDKFRAFAIRAIDYYSSNYPGFNWRVLKWRKLPKRKYP